MTLPLCPGNTSGIFVRLFVSLPKLLLAHSTTTTLALLVNVVLSGKHTFSLAAFDFFQSMDGGSLSAAVHWKEILDAELDYICSSDDLDPKRATVAITKSYYDALQGKNHRSTEMQSLNETLSLMVLKGNVDLSEMKMYV